MAKKTWLEKLHVEKTFKIKILDKAFADLPEGCKMLIASPPIVNEYVHEIPFGTTTTLGTMRQDLALAHDADKTCPVTSGIYLRIVSEVAFEELKAGKDTDEVAPFWRIVEPKSKLASKLTCGVDFIIKQRALESPI